MITLQDLIGRDLDLGLGEPRQDKRVAVAMSGGVDSSVTAALLQRAGYAVVGLTLQLYRHGERIERPGTCCAGQDVLDARTVAHRIGIPHYTLDYETRFHEEVVDRFADSYVRGETPIPCVLCNETIKFGDLSRAAKELAADALVTGHYIRFIAGPEGPELHRAAESARDQSYFLFSTPRAQLSFLRFPLGDFSKDQIREVAAALDLPIARKPDSQDICFVPDGHYTGLVSMLRPDAVAPGEIVHIDGTVLGRHEGIIHYTIGQRRGLGIGGRASRDGGSGRGGGGKDNEPLYVVRLDPTHHRVIVGPKEALACKTVRLKAFNWLGPGAGPSPKGEAVDAKLRSTQPAAPALLFPDPQDSTQAYLELKAPQYGVAPGQAGVVYQCQGTRLLGGGWICAAETTKEER